MARRAIGFERLVLPARFSLGQTHGSAPVFSRREAPGEYARHSPLFGESMWIPGLICVISYAMLRHAVSSRAHP